MNRECRVWQRSLDVHCAARSTCGARGLLAASAGRACSLVKPEQPAAALRAGARAAPGRSRQSCRRPRRPTPISRRSQPADRDNYELLSAEQWVLASNIRRPSKPSRRYRPAARTTMPASRALVAAEIALAERDGATRDPRARHDSGADLAAARAKLLVAARQGRVPHRTSGRRHARLRRARALHRDPQALRASREELLTLHPRRRRSAASRSKRRRKPIRSSPAGSRSDRSPPTWRAIPRTPRRRSPIGSAHSRTILAAISSSPVRQVPFRRWARGVQARRSRRKIAAAPAPIFHEQIALLLPLSGRSESVGTAVRDGFIAAYLQQDPATRPRSKSTMPPPSPWPAPTGMPSTTARHSSWARSPKRMSPQWCRCAPRRLPSSRSISSATR